MNKEENSLISHRPEGRPLEAVISELRGRIIAEGDKPCSSVAEQLSWLEQLTCFELGRFLLTHRGLNGYWTHYAVYLHPRRRHTNGDIPSLGQLEQFLLDRAPTILATQERFTHFQRIVQDEIDRWPGEELALASVPCGLMADLLTLNYRSCGRVDLAGFDLDDESLHLASELAAKAGLRADLLHEDAWELCVEGRFDVLVSNGLNLYEPDDERVTQLYVKFSRALKPGGLLVTSFLTPPSEWRREVIDPEAISLQKVIISNIIGARWQCFRSTEMSRQQLEAAGFEEIRLIPDRANLFPTVPARRV